MTCGRIPEQDGISLKRKGHKGHSESLLVLGREKWVFWYSPLSTISKPPGKKVVFDGVR
jgi:hypothetical protein